MTTRQTYLEFIQRAYIIDESHVDEEIEKWGSQFASSSLLGYTPTRFPLQIGATAAYLYEQTGDKRLARRASDLFLRYREFTKVYPAEAASRRPEYTGGIVPPLDMAFDPVVFAPAVERIRPELETRELVEFAGIAADSLALIWRFPEWGGHNRAMLRAASLAVCARAFPDHPKADEWLSMADELSEESWGRWPIEDTMMYQSHWLRALILYSEAQSKTDITDFIQPRMLIRAMVQMLSPLGILPNYGDSHWLMHSPWEWIALFEWGARSYHDPSMKWAAEKIWKERAQAEKPNIYAATVMTLAHRWCDDSIAPVTPGNSQDALDDLVTKKLVFRTGWREEDVYACVNYRDEGDYARITRDYLRTNLAVSAEKMHHGHADEGSFAMLVHQGTLLLSESGYREAPPDGIYRADRFHNRLVWRPTAGLPNQDPWEILVDNGHYRAIRTERLYQTHLLDADFRRIRMIDEAQGLSWDRSIIFIPSIPVWIVIDMAMAHHTAPRTFGLLWWTGEILAQGNDWYDTWIRESHDWINANNSNLRIILPAIQNQPTNLWTRAERRDFHQEQLIASSWRGEQRPGRSINFVTILWPHDPEDKEYPAVETILSRPANNGLAVRIKFRNDERIIGTLSDLTLPYLQEDIRPRYSAAKAETTYGPLTSDAAFIYCHGHLEMHEAGFINGTRLSYAGKLLHEAPSNSMFQEDGQDDP